MRLGRGVSYQSLVRYSDAKGGSYLGNLVRRNVADNVEGQAFFRSVKASGGFECLLRFGGLSVLRRCSVYFFITDS
jgi:hypothetical protein